MNVYMFKEIKNLMNLKYQSRKVYNNIIMR